MLSALRLLTLFVSFASLQLSLASGGAGCPMPWGQAAAELSGMEMAGMDMAGMEMSGAPGAQRQATNPEAPWDESAAPNDCTSMTPCVFAAVPQGGQLQRPDASEPSRAVGLIVTMPLSVVLSPELPPPRA